MKKNYLLVNLENSQSLLTQKIHMCNELLKKFAQLSSSKLILQINLILSFTVCLLKGKIHKILHYLNLLDVYTYVPP